MDNKQPNGSAMREVPPDERPRERLATVGADALRNAELLAILFRTGTREMNAIRLAELLLENYDHNLLRLARASIEELQRIKGIGRVKAIEIRAALELGLRMLKAKTITPVRITSSDDVKNLLQPELRAYETEEFICLHLNTKNDLIKTERVCRGGMDWVNVLPRDVFRQAIRNGAHGVIVVHNHPSGDPEPSPADVAITKRLATAAEMLGLRFLDHIILGSERHISFKERGLM